MRIIVVNDHGSVTGGAAQVAIASLNALAESGFEVTFVSSVGPIDKGINNQRVRVINFGFDDLMGNPSRINAAFHGLWDFRCARKFGAVLDEYSPEDTVVHFHTWVKSLTSSVIFEALKRGFKIVVTLHDYFSICPNGGLFNYADNEHCLIKPMSVRCALVNCDSRSRAEKTWRFARHLAQYEMGGVPKRIDNFITVSDYSERLLKPYLHPNARFFRVRNPIDIVKSAPSNASHSNIFLFVGRLSPEKGATFFARAAKQANVRAAFVGQGVESEAILKANPESVLLGWNDRSGVVSHMRASRALVFPSILHETQGLAVVEAAALGIPAIVSDGCAAQDGIIANVTGLLFKSGDVEDLARKLVLLNDNSDLARQFGKAAYENYWKAPSTIDTHVQDLIKCYQEILK